MDLVPARIREPKVEALDRSLAHAGERNSDLRASLHQSPGGTVFPIAVVRSEAVDLVKSDRSPYLMLPINIAKLRESTWSVAAKARCGNHIEDQGEEGKQHQCRYKHVNEC